MFVVFNVGYEIVWVESSWIEEVGTTDDVRDVSSNEGFFPKRREISAFSPSLLFLVSAE